MTENNSGVQYTVPMAPAGYGTGMADGFGGGWGMWMMFLFFLLIGNGGYGGWGGMDGLYPWMNNSQNINNGFRDQQLTSQLTGIQTTLNSNAMENLTASYNGQITMLQGFNGLQSQFAQCCCENRTADLQNTQAVLTAINTGIQSVKDQLCTDKIEAKNDTIAQLRSELLYARGQASQDVQTAAIQAGQRALANEVEQYVAPKAVPAYIVQNPNCCASGCNGTF